MANTTILLTAFLLALLVCGRPCVPIHIDDPSDLSPKTTSGGSAPPQPLLRARRSPPSGGSLPLFAGQDPAQVKKPPVWTIREEVRGEPNQGGGLRWFVDLARETIRWN